MTRREKDFKRIWTSDRERNLRYNSEGIWLPKVVFLIIASRLVRTVNTDAI